MELSYASKKIKSQRRLNIFKLAFVIFCNFLIVTLLYLIFYFFINKAVHIVKDNLGVFISIIIALLIAVLSSIVVGKIFYIKLNKSYQKFYNKLLADEAMLDGLALFKNVIPLNEVEITTIKKYVGIEDFKSIYSLTQTSSIAYFDMYQVMCANEEAVLIKTKIDLIQNEMIIIRNDGKKGELSFENKGLKQYGIGQGNLYNQSNGFTLYTTIGEKIYGYLKTDLIPELYDFAKFVKAPLVMTMFDDNLFIYIYGWKLNLAKSVFNKDGIAIIDAQIEALKQLQRYIEHMTELINTNLEEEK